MPRAVTPAGREREPAQPPAQKKRISTIDWMRGLVMILMVIDHASMAFDGHHVAEDSALYPGAGTMALPAAAFFTRWITHLCAPTFVFLAGTALTLSVERRMAKGASAWSIDRDILIRGAVIAAMDPTIISLGSGRWTFQVVFEERIGFRKNGPLLVFGQTAMFYYLVHRLVMEIPATYFGLRGVGDITTTYAVTAVLLVTLYPLCRWYRQVKTNHPDSFLRYL